MNSFYSKACASSLSLVVGSDEGGADVSSVEDSGSITEVLSVSEGAESYAESGTCDSVGRISEGSSGVTLLDEEVVEGIV